MAKTLEEIKASFETADTNKNQLLNDIETATALTSLSLKMQKEEVDFYVKTVGQNKSGLIDSSEFELLVRFCESHLKFIDGFLSILGISLSQFKQLFNSASAYYSEESHIKIHISDQDSKNANYLTSVTALGGSIATNPHLAKIVTETYNSKFALVFDIGVKNGLEIVEMLNQKLVTTKEILCEMSQESKDFFEKIDFIAIPTKNGVQIIIDFSKDSVFNVYSQIISKNMEMLENHPLQLYLQAKTTADFDNLKVPFAKYVGEIYSLDFEFINFSFSHLLNNSDFKQMIKSMVDSKSPFIALMILLISMKSFNFVMNLDHKVRSKLSTQAEEISKNVSFQTLITTFVDKINEQNGQEFLEIFEDTKEIFRILKKNETSNTGVFLKIHNIYLGVDIRANIYKALNQILKLE